MAMVGERKGTVLIQLLMRYLSKAVYPCVIRPCILHSFIIISLPFNVSDNGRISFGKKA